MVEPANAPFTGDDQPITQGTDSGYYPGSRITISHPRWLWSWCTQYKVWVSSSPRKARTQAAGSLSFGLSSDKDQRDDGWASNFTMSSSESLTGKIRDCWSWKGVVNRVSLSHTIWQRRWWQASWKLWRQHWCGDVVMRPTRQQTSMTARYFVLTILCFSWPCVVGNCDEPIQLPALRIPMSWHLSFASHSLPYPYLHRTREKPYGDYILEGAVVDDLNIKLRLQRRFITSKSSENCNCNPLHLTKHRRWPDPPEIKRSLPDLGFCPCPDPRTLHKSRRCISIEYFCKCRLLGLGSGVLKAIARSHFVRSILCLSCSWPERYPLQCEKLAHAGQLRSRGFLAEQGNFTRSGGFLETWKTEESSSRQARFWRECFKPLVDTADTIPPLPQTPREMISGNLKSCSCVTKDIPT